MADGNGRILDLNGRRKPHDKGADLCTKAEAQAIAVQVSEFYANQFPGLVAHMLKEAFQAAGIQMPLPPQVEAPQEPT